jgi:hypothetical protein
MGVFSHPDRLEPEMVNGLIGLSLIWLAMASGILKLSIAKDAWERTCYEHYWHPRLRKPLGFASVLILAPAGFFIAMHYSRKMRKHPLDAPDWAYQAIADLEAIEKVYEAMDESLGTMEESLRHGIESLHSFNEENRRDCQADGD